MDSSTKAREIFLCNGVTVTRTIPFRLLSEDHVAVYRLTIADGTLTPLVLNSGGALGFSVANVGDANAEFTTITAFTNAYKLIALRAIPITQESDYVANDSFPAEVAENDFDKAIQILQQHQDILVRGLFFPITTSVSSPMAGELPTPVDGYGLVWDGTAGKMRNTAASLETLEDAATAIAAITAQIATVAAIDTEIVAVAGNAGDITTVAGIATAVSTVAANSTDVSTVATNIAAVIACAADITDIQAAPAAAAAAVAAQTAAEAARDLAQNYAASLTGTSITSLSVGTGTKTLTTQTNKAFVPGMYVRYAKADGTYIMDGIVTSYNSGTGELTITVAAGDYTVDGGGSNASWNVMMTGQRGQQGATGSSGAGIGLTEVTGTSQSAAVNNGYILNNAGLVTVTLPAAAAIGDEIQLFGLGAGGWRLAQNASQQVIFGNAQTTSGTGGRLDSTNRYDALTVRCIVANTTFSVKHSVGNIDVT